ncbi:gamma-glutamyl-gamma-aminobutyrate hydrolase family protein [Pleionea mediterranea]|jgi:putative glutamine amidotransferase|uniref:Putative glutamine amidotransferase n=1 Tax=Pleionea mediterranea TaxID=523701 RepID=A0A316FEL8_9GAMM|nr:type 1 glutamine amidotransferase [Pleionea mediterranea]PWK47314.1 putative glutamine amidotransferase [Pleionea mediterranea]
MSDNKKPLIAVTGPKKRFPVGWWAIRFNLALAGLRAVYRYPDGPKVDQKIDGLIISGGDDIHPTHYGDPENEASRYDPARDQLEMDMLKAYLPENIPILGICRGAQLLNVVLKGTLHADIRPERKLTPNKYTAFPIKSVELEQDSRLADCVTPQTLTVNSLHNQAVKSLGEGLVVTAKDADGFIQAIERQDRFIVGVQWHPEYLPYISSQRDIFKCFAKAVRDNIVLQQEKALKQ